MKENKTEENEIEIAEIYEVEESTGENKEVIPQTTLIVTELLKKNNELLEYHNKVMIANKKMSNLNIGVNILFKIILIPTALVFCFFLYKIYMEVVLNNQKETTIVNNLPEQETPVFNVNVPPSNVEVREQTILDKVSFYRGGYHGYVYKNTSKNIVYCRTNAHENIYDIVLTPNSNLELTYEIYSCKDAELIETKNPNEVHRVKESLFNVKS